MSTDCIFCQIASGKIPADVLHKDDKVIAFRDINPLAPTHVVIIPRKHIPALADLSNEDLPLISHMVKVANDLALAEGIADKGYRITVNCGAEGGQLVGHLHMHLMGGRKLSDKLG